MFNNKFVRIVCILGQFRFLHPYVSQRLVSLFETLAKKHVRLDAQLKAAPTSNGAVAVDVTTNTEDMVIFGVKDINFCFFFRRHQIAILSSNIKTFSFTISANGSQCFGRSSSDGSRNIEFMPVPSACLLSEFSVHFVVQTTCF